MVISVEKMSIYPVCREPPWFVHIFLLWIIKVASFYPPEYPSFGHLVCKRNFKKGDIKESHCRRSYFGLHDQELT